VLKLSGTRPPRRDMTSSSSPSEAMVYLSGVDKIYPPDQAALRGISLGISRGEFVFVAGASGAGKSTLLKLLFAQERVTGGEISVGGYDLRSAGRDLVTLLRRRVGVIFQDYKLLETFSVLDNVAFTLEVLGVKKRERSRLAYSMLKAVGLEERVHAYPPTLSGGEQQRVSIARALVNRPSIILADEPTGNLDPDMSSAVFALLLEANQCGATVVVASHNLALIEELNRRTLVLDRGRLIGDFANPRG